MTVEEGSASEFSLEFGVEKAKRAEEDLIASAQAVVGPANAELIVAMFEVGFRYGQADMAEALEHDLDKLLG